MYQLRKNLADTVSIYGSRQRTFQTTHLILRAL